MIRPAVRRFLILRTSSSSADAGGVVVFHGQKSTFSSNNTTKTDSLEKNRWFTLPPYTATVNGSVLGKRIVNQESEEESVNSTALKWVLRCCPELPRSLVQKLFRLRKVRRGSSMIESSECTLEVQGRQLKRVAAKDTLNIGDQVFLPISVQVLPTEKKHEQDCCSKEEEKFIHSLVLYKDPDILVINKPPGLPVQGGIGIKRSLDELAAICLSNDYSEQPWLVHRLDRDSSGILVMGRTSTSTTVLHSIFREKTFGPSKHEVNNERGFGKKVLGTCNWVSKTSKGID